MDQAESKLHAEPGNVNDTYSGLHAWLHNEFASNLASTTDDGKLNASTRPALSAEQSQDFRTMENGILGGDLKSVQSTIQKYENDPAAAEPVLKALVNDLNIPDLGIEAYYWVNPATTCTTAQAAILHLESSNKATKETVQIDLIGSPILKSTAEHLTPKGSGLDRSNMPLDQALKEIGEHASMVLKYNQSHRID